MAYSKPSAHFSFRWNWTHILLMQTLRRGLRRMQERKLVRFIGLVVSVHLNTSHICTNPGRHSTWYLCWTTPCFHGGPAREGQENLGVLRTQNSELTQLNFCRNSEQLCYWRLRRKRKQTGPFMSGARCSGLSASLSHSRTGWLERGGQRPDQMVHLRLGVQTTSPKIWKCRKCSP
jgi:hypothetical protein